jgi:ketosteroid isomerase-like protein
MLRAMSSANLDLVRSIFAAWERGDYSSADWADPEIEFVVADGPDPGSWKGLPAIAEWLRDRLRTIEDFRIAVDEARELDSERVLVLVRASGRWKRSGLELGQMRTEGVNLFHVRGGKVTRFVRYLDRERALAELGLAPEGDDPG